MSTPDEKRKYRRISNEFNVRIATERAVNDIRDLNIDIVKSINISGSGLLVNIKEPIEIGAKIRITFLKPNTFDFFEGYGSIVRIEDNADGTFEVAVNFIDLSPAEKKRLDYYLQMCK